MKTQVRPNSEAERVWLLCGVALAALFLLRTAGMIFQGAITGLGMFVAIWVLFSWFPPIKRLLFSLGGIFDLAVSFGLPYVIASVLNITGGTMLIATITCGLMFTFVLATRKLGGPVIAISKSAKCIIRDTVQSFEAWREEQQSGRDQMDPRRTESDFRTRMRRQREETEGQAPRNGRGRHSRRPLVLGQDYSID